MIDLAVSPRSGAKAKHLRKSGWVPVGIQSGGSTLACQASEYEAVRALHRSGGQTLRVRNGDREFQALVKNVQMERGTRQLLALTLQEVNVTDTVKVSLPIHALGTPDSVDDRTSTITFPTTHIEVSGVLNKLPDAIEVDVSAMGAGDHLLAGDIALPEGMTLVSSPDAVVATTQVNQAMVHGQPTEEAETAAEGETPAES